jgi:hypothetical protein
MPNLKSRHETYYVLLLIPIILFFVSLYTPPTIDPDSGVGFLALRSMLEGGAFNSVTTPDPANIANDVITFLTWWSPGQYLVPGIFILLGMPYGVALSLTALIATLIGVVGWIQVARSFAVSSFVLFVFTLGLTTFPYVTDSFRVYTGGNLLLFATAPWSLYAMRWSADKSPILCFIISLLSGALLFFAKLTGLVVFAANVVGITLSSLSQRQPSSSTIAMWTASVMGALCFMVFWVGRGAIPASGSAFAFSWLPIWFSLASLAFSGIYGLDLFLGHPWLQVKLQWPIAELQRAIVELLGLLGLPLMVWVWCQLRHTRCRDMAVLLVAIILVYAIALTTMYLRGAEVSLEDRHFRYAGILFFLLLLAAIDQWGVPAAKSLVWAVVIVLGLYNLRNYAAFTYLQVRATYHDPKSAVLEYMRSEVTRHRVQRPIAVVWPSVAIRLPEFRILLVDCKALPSMDMRAALKWAGRTEKIFVVVPEEMHQSGDTEAMLRSFTDYDLDSWSRLKFDGITVYTQ